MRQEKRLELFHAHRGFAVHLAASAPLRLRDEAVTVALGVLWEILPRWDPARGRLTTFAAPHIRHALIELRRHADPVPFTRDDYRVRNLARRAAADGETLAPGRDVTAAALERVTQLHAVPLDDHDLTTPPTAAVTDREVPLDRLGDLRDRFTVIRYLGLDGAPPQHLGEIAAALGESGETTRRRFHRSVALLAA